MKLTDMDSDLAQDAINAALNEEWKKAIEINLRILKESKDDIDALNRLARAYAEIGEKQKAKSISKKVLELDPNNLIAARCLEKWNNFIKTDTNKQHAKNLANMFIEVGSKTKTITLINLGEQSVLRSLNCGDTVILSAAKHRVNILTADNKYIGRFPDNLAIKFINLIKLGTSFQSVIKSVDKNEVKVLVYADSKNDF
jgi:tetratricopeptide (TPR) repeat protein